MHRINLFFILLFSLLNGNMVSAQGNCTESLPKANKLYHDGELKGSIDLLNSCFKTFKSKEEKIEVYRLLGKCYMALGDEKMAHTIIKKLLRLKPDYAEYAIGNEPSNFLKAINSYEVKPNISLGFFAAISLNQPNVVVNNSPYPYAKSYYKVTGGYLLGLDIAKVLKPKWSILGRVYVSGSTIKHQLVGMNIRDIEYLERYDFMNAALGLSYRIIEKGKWRLSFHGLFGGAYLYKDYSVLTYTHNENNQIEQISFKAKDERNEIQSFIGGGFEIKRKLASGNLSLIVNYMQHLNTMFPNNESVGNLNRALNLNYFNDQLRLKYSSLEFKYSFPLTHSISRN